MEHSKVCQIFPSVVMMDVGYVCYNVSVDVRDNVFVANADVLVNVRLDINHVNIQTHIFVDINLDVCQGGLRWLHL